MRFNNEAEWIIHSMIWAHPDQLPTVEELKYSYPNKSGEEIERLVNNMDDVNLHIEDVNGERLVFCESTASSEMENGVLREAYKMMEKTERIKQLENIDRSSIIS